MIWLDVTVYITCNAAIMEVVARDGRGFRLSVDLSTFYLASSLL